MEQGTSITNMEHGTRNNEGRSYCLETDLPSYKYGIANSHGKVERFCQEADFTVLE